MKKKVSILVSRLRYKKPSVDDIVLRDTLIKIGLNVDIINWDNEDYDFSKSDLVLIMSCSDCFERTEEFIRILNKISKVTTLINPLSTMIESTNKSYLKSLRKKGIPIVDADIGNTKQLKSIIDNANQKSTIIINGEIVSSYIKKASEESFLVLQEQDKMFSASQIDSKELFFLSEIVNSLPEKTAYVKIDYLFNEKYDPMLLDLDMIDTDLHLSTNRVGLYSLCDYIVDNLC